MWLEETHYEQESGGVLRRGVSFADTLVMLERRKQLFHFGAPG